MWGDTEGISQVFDGAHLLLNLAGKSVSCRYNRPNKAEICRSRLETTVELGRALATCAAGGGRPQSEYDGELGTCFSVDVARAWEQALNDAEAPGVRKVTLRIAIVLGPGGVMRPFVNLARCGLGGRQGKGSQQFSWIHVEDLLQVILFLAEHRELAEVRRAPRIPFGLPTPKWLLELGAVLRTGLAGSRPAEMRLSYDGRMTPAKPVDWMERHQIGLYLCAIAAGAMIGWLVPAAAGPLEMAINPVLGLLLYATVLGIPFAQLGRAVRDVRFMAAVLLLNFAAVPLVVFLLSRFVAGNDALLVGVLLVLLTPCIDYVIVFSGLAGGASDRLLAAAPLLVSVIDAKPFVQALVFLILLPLALAALTQALGRTHAAGQAVKKMMQGLMVPLMMLTLAVVTGSQIAGVGHQLPALFSVIPLYAVFLVVMVPIGLLAGRAARLDTPGTRAVIFSGATRNSLVILPLALALPAPLALASLVVVTQTLVELIGMVIYVKIIPRIARTAAAIHT